jgi:hypothetical protein
LAAVDAAADAAVAQTGVDTVGVARVDSEALRAASGQGEFGRPCLTRFVEPGNAVAGCGIKPGQLILR